MESYFFRVASVSKIDIHSGTAMIDKIFWLTYILDDGKMIPGVRVRFTGKGMIQKGKNSGFI